MINDCAISGFFLSAFMQDNARMAALGRQWLLSIRGDVMIAEDGSVLPGQTWEDPGPQTRRQVGRTPRKEERAEA